MSSGPHEYEWQVVSCHITRSIDADKDIVPKNMPVSEKQKRYLKVISICWCKHFKQEYYSYLEEGKND